jgi:hypothetical protein
MKKKLQLLGKFMGHDIRMLTILSDNTAVIVQQKDMKPLGSDEIKEFVPGVQNNY